MCIYTPLSISLSALVSATIVTNCASSLDAEQASLAVPSGMDFGLHPCDAGVVCGGELSGDLVAMGHQWHPGRLLYYNRAELKQSDHR